MDIIDAVSHVEGTINFECIIGTVIFSIFVCSILFLFIMTLRELITNNIIYIRNKNTEILSLVFYSIILIISCIALVLFATNIKEKETYTEYKVIFTEPVNIDEINKKYIIKKQKGNIWYLEDKH